MSLAEETFRGVRLVQIASASVYIYWAPGEKGAVAPHEIFPMDGCIEVICRHHDGIDLDVISAHVKHYLRGSPN